MKPIPQKAAIITHPPRMQRTRRWRRFRRSIIPLSLVLISLFLKLRDLGHPSLTYYDESFHALVARNLVDHPLKPVLVEHPWLPYDYKNWRENHIWLHKGILPLWQIAASFAIFGINTFALRLPSAILASLSVWLTWRIGRLTIGRKAALIAAALQTVLPPLAKLVHGYWFSDHIDTALLFWIELGMYCLIIAHHTGRHRYAIAAGAASGLAFLCKSYPGFIVVAVSIGLFALSRLTGKHTPKSTWRIPALTILGALIVAAPWTLWCAWQYPQEFQQELLHVGQHLNTDVEGWAAPWDRLIFDYLILIFSVFYAPLIVAIITAMPSVATRRMRWHFLFLWSFGVIIPFLLATTKTPSATIIAVPPLLLLLGHLFQVGWTTRPFTLAAWLGVVTMGIIEPVAPRSGGQGYPDPPVFGGIMRHELWVVRHVLIAMVFAAIVSWLLRLIPSAFNGACRTARIASLLCTLWLISKCVKECWTVGVPNPKEPSYADIGRLINENLPQNAAILVDRHYLGENTVMEFFAHRTCYPLTADVQQVAQQLRAAGAIPYAALTIAQSATTVLSSPVDHWMIYECPK